MALVPSVIPLGTALPRRTRRSRHVIALRVTKAGTVTLRFSRACPACSASWKPLRTRVRVHVKAGLNRIRFAGRLTRSRSLRPGRYRLTAVVTDTAGARSHPVMTRFRIVAPRR